MGTAMGFPTETYQYGLVTFWLAFTLFIANILAVFYFIPIWHRLQLPSVYMFLEMRFHRYVKKTCFYLELFQQMFYFGVTTYLPALALSAVSEISLNFSIFLTTALCTLYTTMGGLKAVIWTDALQGFIMLAGQLAGLIGGLIYVGGFSNVHDALERSDRLNMFTFDLDPRIRTTFWTIFVGYSMGLAGRSCTDQTMMQRFLSTKSINTARWASLHSLWPKIVISLVALSCGAVAYAVFEGCDPVKNGELHKLDQIMPYLVLKTCKAAPGLAGLFVSAAYSGTLSTVSSGINAFSVVILEDIIKPFFPKKQNFATINKCIGITLGAIIGILAFSISKMPGSIWSLILSVAGGIKGPVFGIYILGIFFPWTTTKGASFGGIVGFILGNVINFGRLTTGADPYFQRSKITSIDQCEISENSTHLHNLFETTSVYSNFTARSEDMENDTPEYISFFQVSMYYIGVIGILSTMISGAIFSLISGPNDPKKADPKLFMPMFPGKFFRFGVPALEEGEEKKIEETSEQELKLLKTSNLRDGLQI